MPHGEHREAKPNVYIKCLFLEDCVVWCLGGHSPPPGYPELETRQEAESWPLPAPPLHTRVDCGLLCSQGRQLVLFLPWHLLRTLVTSAETSPSAPPGPDPPLSTHFSVSESTAEPSSSKAIFHFCSLPVLRSSFLRLHSQYPCPNTAVLSSLGHKTQGSSWPQLSS